MSVSIFSLLLLFIVFLSSQAFSQVVQIQQQQQIKDLKDGSLFIERIMYNDNVYSKSKKTELGDQVIMESALRYQYSSNTFIRTRFQTNPQENRTDNQTSNFELLFNHTYNNLLFQADLDLDTDSQPNGGTRMGFDTSSPGTFLAWSANKNLSFTFYPFNFNGRVGWMFDTWYVNRVSYINNSPSSVTATPLNSEKTVSKTIPGLEAQWRFDNGLNAYAGYGVATYLFPGNSNFDIESNPSADRWSRKESNSVKAGLFYREVKKIRFNAQYVTQNNTEESGALLASAASLNTLFQKDRVIVQAEVTMSQAGNAPWRLKRDGTWFQEQTPFQPIYKDTLGKRQDWIGKTDFAYGLKVGLDYENVVPYLSLQYQGKNFIYNERKDSASAHILRTADESKSHGGLLRIGTGAHFYVENYMIVPQIEYRIAHNPVFSNSSDVREDRILSSFKKTDYVIALNVVYSLNDWFFFRP